MVTTQPDVVNLFEEHERERTTRERLFYRGKHLGGSLACDTVDPDQPAGVHGDAQLPVFTRRDRHFDTELLSGIRENERMAVPVTL